MICRVPLFVLEYLYPPAALLAPHGPPMVSGLLGVFISLERSVALGVCWAYEGMIFGVLGGVLLIRGQHLQARAVAV